MFDLDMGAYGFFVWGAYGISAVMLAGLTLRVWSRARAAKRDLDRAEAAAERAR